MNTNKNILTVLTLSASLALGHYSAVALNDNLGSEVTDSVTTSAVDITVTENGVQICLSGEESMELTVYAITGQIVKSQKLEPGITSIELFRGYYIVRVGREAKRVVIN